MVAKFVDDLPEGGRQADRGSSCATPAIQPSFSGEKKFGREVFSKGDNVQP
jgi:hypothetical protein